MSAQPVYLKFEGMWHRATLGEIIDDGPFALRYPRGEAVGVPLPDRARRLEIGKGEVLRRGERVALLGYGSGVGVALEAATLLREAGIEATVADARWAKPLDVELVRTLASSHELLVTLEEGVLAGGFGSAVLEAGEEHGIPLATAGGVAGVTQVLRIGLPDRYVTHGAPKLLHQEVGFTGSAVARRVATALGVRDGVPAQA